MTDKALLDVMEAAHYLSVGRSAIYRAIERGDLRGVKIARSRRFPRAELDEYISRLRAHSLEAN